MAGALTVRVDWEALGADASAAVDEAHAILVTGIDPVATARVAIGIGQVLSRSRRVAIGDLVGDVEPLLRLVTGDDPHGIVDSFLYGVSLNKIARQVDDAGMLFVMPSGTEPNVTPDIMRNERWSRLAAGFREVGALLVLVASSESEGVSELAAMLDGVVIVGDESPALRVPPHTVLAQIQPPMSEADVPVPTPAPAPPAPAPEEPAPVVEEPVMVSEPTPTEVPAPEPPRRRKAAAPEKRTVPVPMMVAAGVVLLAGLWFLLGRPGLPSATPAVQTVSDSAGVTDDVRAADDTVVEAGAGADAGATSLSAVRVANPQDSARAVPYGVVLVATNDEAQALARWADLGLKLPAGTVTMVNIRGERGRFFQVQAGAFATAQQADSLLAALRADRRLGAGAGSVSATPYAIVLEPNVSQSAARAIANAYGQRQIAAYPMLQADNSAAIYVGAFETPDQAAPLLNALSRKGVNAALHYRTGRGF
ncbi:MAG: SPOR domain-containing protein [Gemmatimonadota bacterium]